MMGLGSRGQVGDRHRRIPLNPRLKQKLKEPILLSLQNERDKEVAMKEATSSDRDYRASHLYGWASSNCILSRCGNFHISTYLLIGGTIQAPVFTHMYTHIYMSVYTHVYNEHGVCRLEQESGNLQAFRVGAQEYSAGPTFHSVSWAQHQG